MALIPFLQGHGLPYGWAWFLSQTVFILVICLVLMLSVAAVILADRKIWAAVQMRRGPNVVGPFGLLQTIADAVKFLLKEVIVPAGANKVLFFIAPLISVMLAFIAWESFLSITAGLYQTSMLASSICLQCPRLVSMAW